MGSIDLHNQALYALVVAQINECNYEEVGDNVIKRRPGSFRYDKFSYGNEKHMAIGVRWASKNMSKPPVVAAVLSRH